MTWGWDLDLGRGLDSYGIFDLSFSFKITSFLAFSWVGGCLATSDPSCHAETNQRSVSIVSGLRDQQTKSFKMRINQVKTHTIWLIFMVDVGNYTIHGWYGKCQTSAPWNV